MLSVVATPIGNLKDISVRACETLQACDGIICEDTRVTGLLLQRLGLPKKPLTSLHSFSTGAKADALLQQLRDGKHLVLVSDAGTPGISDPGYAVVSRAREAGIRIESVPGPAAFLAALSTSGLPINRFVYLGFPPLKKGRQTLWKHIAREDATVVLYESVHRIERTLRELATALEHQPDRQVAIGRELTKLHEEMVQTRIAQLPETAAALTKKGEFVVIIGPAEFSHTTTPSA